MPNPAIICHDSGSSVSFTFPIHPVEKLLVVESLYPTRIDNFFGFDGGGFRILFGDIFDDDLEPFRNRIGFAVAVELFLGFKVEVFGGFEVFQRQVF